MSTIKSSLTSACSMSSVIAMVLSLVSMFTLLLTSQVVQAAVPRGSTYNTFGAKHYDGQIVKFLMDYKNSTNYQQIHHHHHHHQQKSHEEDEQHLIITHDHHHLHHDHHHHRRIEENFTPTTKAYFVQLCTGYLLGDEVTGDNEISNAEAAQFFEFLCTELEKPSCMNKTIPFHSLLLQIQMQFVVAICPSDFNFLETDDPSCIDELRKEVNAKNKFGYNITEDNREQVNEDITQYCSNVYALSSEFHYGTYAPSPSPSFSPSPTILNPTISPYPTTAPIISPTPSVGPTNSPSTSASPTSMIEYKTAFTYMMGFNNEQIPQTLASGGGGGGGDGGDELGTNILDETESAIINVLTNLSNNPALSSFRISTNDIRLRRGLTTGGHGSGTDEGNSNKGPTRTRTRTRDLQQQQKLAFSSDDGNGVEHLYHQEAECTSDFTQSSDCLVIVSEVSLLSSSNNVKIDKELVSKVIYGIMKFTIDNESFRKIIGIDDIVEIQYLNDGNQPPINDPTRGFEPQVGVGGGSIAGITIGSVIALLCLAFFVGRARARSEDRSIQQDELSDDDYLNPDEDAVSDDDVERGIDDPALMSTTEDVKSRSRQLPLGQENVNAEDQSDTNEDQSLTQTGLQFDPATGEVTGSAAMSYASSYKSIGSGYSADDPETPGKGTMMDNGDMLVDQLDEAVHAGDWAAVAAIAGDLSQADDISTMSSLHSRAGDISYDPSERSNLAPPDAKRAAQIDKLIAEGDWNAVGATAAAFESEVSEDSPEKRSLPPQEQPTAKRGKSLLDFISGPWQSKSASEAIVDSNDDNADIISSNSDLEEQHASFENVGRNDSDGEQTPPFTNVNDVVSVSDPSDLSAGEPKSPSKTTGTLVALGTVGTAGAAAAALYHSESDTTEDDKRQLISPAQKKKRSWAARFLRRKNHEKENVASSSLALQEDSSVSSWSKGEDSSPETTMNLYGGSKTPADDMPAEMKAFGEDHGLAAAEQAMMEEEERKQQKLKESSVDESENELSQKSSGSLRDELDKAIESGDWAAVEKQTNQMLETGKNNSHDLSELDSEADSEAMEGWSQDGPPTDYESEAIDDDRIEMLEKLIETDDWQGIVDDSQIHTKSESAVLKD